MSSGRGTMVRVARFAIPVLVLACGLSGAGQQGKHTVARTPSKPASRPQEQASPPAATLTRAIRENNLGLALMDRRDFSATLGKFQTACVMNPDSDTGCLNIGIALLNMGRYDDSENIL